MPRGREPLHTGVVRRMGSPPSSYPELQLNEIFGCKQTEFSHVCSYIGFTVKFSKPRFKSARPDQPEQPMPVLHGKGQSLWAVVPALRFEILVGTSQQQLELSFGPPP